MLGNKFVSAAMVAGMLSWAAAAQQKTQAPQSARQAIIEMFSGGEDAFKKHLTVEVQAKVTELLKNAAPNVNPLQAVTTAKAMGGDHLESFEAGPILFSFNNPQRHERLEIRIDADEVRGNEDNMQLSLRSVRNGVAQDTPIGVRLELGWKQQQGIWRLNALRLNISVPVGDPRILDKSTWPIMSSLDSAGPAPAPTPATDAPPKIAPARSVRLIGLLKVFTPTSTLVSDSPVFMANW